ncbi:MAG: double-strand break repair helicase AddA [Acetobacter sp.]|nr:double-strand break repair helicase AddA [Acetobacter sp.]
MTKEQIRASNPTASVFVSASAGSGKTRVLINRLLRLMLPHKNKQGYIHPGCSPDRILCLTFTNTAATEMTTRLQEELGQWATLSDYELDKKLREFDITPNSDTRKEARALFTKVLDLPGGMRISTIHSFCQSLLRCFPIEANLNPRFTLLDENDADTILALQHSLKETLIHVPEEFIEPLASRITLNTFTEYALSLCKERQAQPILERANSHPDEIATILYTALGIDTPIPQTEDTILEQACSFSLSQEDALRKIFHEIEEKAKGETQKRFQKLQEWLSYPVHERKAKWQDTWCDGFFTKKGEPRKKFIPKELTKHPAIVNPIEYEIEHIHNVRKQLAIRRLLTYTESFIQSVAPIARRFNNQKAYQGALEYDDLIHRALNLLKNIGTDWILYKLDSNIDHILLDEVQDTSPEQWEIVKNLTDEFFSGQGTRSEEISPRTLFAVGDYKQSIFGFQGTEPKAFQKWQEYFEKRVKNAQLSWDTPKLETSFRSAPMVLKFVDTVFLFPEAAKGVSREIHHEACEKNNTQHGRIELWPLVSSDDSDLNNKEIDPWDTTSTQSSHPAKTAEQKLADILANYIKDLTSSSSLKEKDILILVQKRSPFVGLLAYALKAKNIPVTNLVRTNLSEQIAVQDLITLCEALLLPQDDLTLACVLTSPLGGLSDDSLMRLAIDRPEKNLWLTLQKRHEEAEDWARAWNFLDTLFNKVDYLNPYTLLCLALGPLGGRVRLLARLGQNAIEPINELLTAALQYQDKHPPSLQGFVHWIQQSKKEIKHKAGTGGQAVRIMTVHGAKGLEAPLVILPDTINTPNSNKKDTCRWISYHDSSSEKDELKIPVYASKDEAHLLPKISKYIEEKQEQEEEEYNRLLYVALTRARNRLVICGYNKIQKNSWYDHCERAFQKLDPHSHKNLRWAANWFNSIDILEENTDSLGENKNTSSPEQKQNLLPIWVGHTPDWTPLPPTLETHTLRTLTTSRSENASSTTSSPAYSPLGIATITPTRKRIAARRRGTLVHTLLQFLPNIPADQQENVARQWLERPINGLESSEAQALTETILSVIRMPKLAPLFAPGAKAEQPLAGIVNGRVIVGQVDRLCILPDRVIVCDFKTGRHIPHNAEKTPVSYLRQMAVYRALLQQLWPNKTIDCVLVWVDEPRADILPDEILSKTLYRHLFSTGNRFSL